MWLESIVINKAGRTLENNFIKVKVKLPVKTKIIEDGNLIKVGEPNSILSQSSIDTKAQAGKWENKHIKSTAERSFECGLRLYKEALLESGASISTVIGAAWA